MFKKVSKYERIFIKVGNEFKEFLRNVGPLTVPVNFSKDTTTNIAVTDDNRCARLSLALYLRQTTWTVEQNHLLKYLARKFAPPSLLLLFIS